MIDNIWDYYCKTDRCFNPRLYDGLCAEHYIGHIREQLVDLQHMIKISEGLSCPNCENKGFTPEQDGFGNWYQEQCEFCYTVKDSVFNRQQSLEQKL